MARFVFAVLVLLFSVSYSQAEWLKVRPVRTETRFSKNLNNIESYLPETHPYRDTDKVTHSHESTHGVNSALRATSPGMFFVYVLNGNACKFAHPRITLRDIANVVPTSMRGDLYNLYLVAQRQYWNNEPAYILEEWNCYLNGCIVGIEYNMQARTLDSLGSAYRFLNFGIAVGYAAEQDTAYDNTELHELIDFLAQRTFEITKAVESKGWDTSRAKQPFETLKNSPDAKHLLEYALKE